MTAQTELILQYPDNLQKFCQGILVVRSVVLTTPCMTVILIKIIHLSNAVSSTITLFLEVGLCDRVVYGARITRLVAYITRTDMLNQATGSEVWIRILVLRLIPIRISFRLFTEATLSYFVRLISKYDLHKLSLPRSRLMVLHTLSFCLSQCLFTPLVVL